MSTTLNSKQDKAPFPVPCKSQGTVGSNLEDEETPGAQENFEFEGSGLSLPASSYPYLSFLSPQVWSLDVQPGETSFSFDLSDDWVVEACSRLSAMSTMSSDSSKLGELYAQPSLWPMRLQEDMKGVLSEKESLLLVI